MAEKIKEEIYHPTLTIYTISLMLGVVLNTMVIVVRVVKYIHKREISSYQFIITQIAVSDLIFAILIAFDIDMYIYKGVWRFSPSLCVFLKPTQSISSSIPGLFMIILAFERYQGIKNTLGQKWTLKKMVIISIIAWLFAILSFIPFGNIIVVANVRIGNQTVNKCFYDETRYPSKLFSDIYYPFVSISFLVIPFLLTTFFHYRIYNFVKSHAKKMSIHRQSIGNPNNQLDGSCCIGSDSSDYKSSADETGRGVDIVERFQCGTIDEVEDDDVFIPQEKPRKNIMGQTLRRIFNSSLNLRKTIREKVLGTRRPRSGPRKLKIHILFAITICFFVCIFPNQLWHHLIKFKVLNPSNSLVKMHQVFACFIYLHCFFNGIIYSVMDKKFRSEAWVVIKSIATLKPYYRQEQAIITARPSRVSIQTTSMS